MEEESEEEEDSFERDAREPRWKFIGKCLRDEEKEPCGVEDEDSPTECGAQGGEEVKIVDSDAGKFWMMEGRDHRRPRIPHFAEELMPERCDIEDEYLPKEHAPWPDGHRERHENFACGFPVYVLLLQSVEREGGDSGRDDKNESEIAQKSISPAKH